MRKLVLAALFALPILFLLPHLNQFPFQPGSPYSDLAISHLPNGLYVQQSIREFGTVPLWSPSILSGYPFAANPLSGLYYLPGLLALLFPLPLGFNLLLTIHLIWAGVGMFLLLRALGLSEPAALFGGLAFEALPKLYAHLGAGHLTLIYAIAWTPWLLYAERRVQSGGRLRWVLPGLALGIIALADVRWTAYAGLLWLVFSLWDNRAGLWPAGKLAAWLGSRLSNALFALFIAAPLLLPLMQYTQLSTRSQLTAAESFILSLPPGQLFGLVYPTLGGSAEWVLYPGAAVFGLLLYALGHAPTCRCAGLWLALFGISLVMALGSFLPPLQLLAYLPGFDLLRVPSRFLFLAGFCAAVTAGYSVHSLFAGLSSREPPARDRSTLALFAVTAFVVLFAIAAWLVVDQPLPRIQFAWGALFLLLVTVLILLAHSRRISSRVLFSALIAVGLVDLIGVNGLSLDFRPVEQVFSESKEAAEFMVEKEGRRPFRVYSPSYSIPQHTAAWYGLELADGVDPLQLSAYASFMESATGVPSDGYSVTMPPFAEGDPTVDNQGYRPDPTRLGLLNVRYMVAEFELDVDGLRPVADFGGTRVYENRRVLPRAWIQAGDARVGEKILAEVSVKKGPNTVRTERVIGPGLLVLSEIAYPGWQVFVDGSPAQIETVAGLLRGVRLGEGEHAVEFRFRPVLEYIGLAAAGLAWAVLAALFFWRQARNG